MKPARFDYYDPTTLAEALSLLAQFGDTAKPLAGGQSLVPMMNMRLARPAQLVDLNRLGELNYLKVEGGELRIGAMTRANARWSVLRSSRTAGRCCKKRRATLATCRLGTAAPSAAAWSTRTLRLNCRWS